MLPGLPPTFGATVHNLFDISKGPRPPDACTYTCVCAVRPPEPAADPLQLIPNSTASAKRVFLSPQGFPPPVESWRSKVTAVTVSGRHRSRTLTRGSIPVRRSRLERRSLRPHREVGASLRHGRAPGSLDVGSSRTLEPVPHCLCDFLLLERGPITCAMRRQCLSAETVIAYLHLSPPLQL